MTLNDATEQAYKNGYEKGYIDALKDVLNNYNKSEVIIPAVLEHLAKQRHIIFNNWNVKKYFRIYKK